MRTLASLPGQAPAFPVTIDNPPGLSAITYRVGDYTSFRQALLQSLPGEVQLQDWRPTEGDLALQLLEWWAYLADILTFYNERIANASYLGTAVLAQPTTGTTAAEGPADPTNAQKIARAVGFRPIPGIAATGKLGVLVNAVARIEVPAGFAVQSKPGPGQKPQVFEADVQASYLPTHAGGAVPVDLFIPTSIDDVQANTPNNSLLVKGTITGIKPDEMVVVALAPYSRDTSTPDAAGFTSTPYSHGTSTAAIVVSLAPEPDPRGQQNTRLTFSAFTPPPSLPANVSPDVIGFQLLRSVQSVPVYSYAPPTGEQVLSVQGGSVLIHLASTVRAIAVGDLIVVEVPNPTPPGPSTYITAAVVDYEEQIWTVTTGSSPPTPPVVPHSILTLEPLDGADTATIVGSTNTVRVWYALRAVGIPLDEFVTGPLLASAVGSTALTPAIAATSSAPAVAATPANKIVPAGVVAANPAFENGYTVLLEGADGVGAVATLTAAPSATSIVLTCSDNATTLVLPLRVLFNVMSVTAGKSVTSEVLGNGDSTARGQSFTLRNSPLTYVAGNDPTFPTSTLQLFVNGVAWTEVASFNGQPSDARVFITQEDPSQTTTVTFGDGVHGARLPTGTGNVTASYRYGSGPGKPSLGGPAVGALTTVLTPQPGLGAIRNPVPMVGGAAPSTASQVQSSAPTSALTFGSAASASDFEAIASQAPLVSSVRAVFGWDPEARRATTTLYVAGGKDAVAAAQHAISRAADPSSPITVQPAAGVPLSLAFVLVYDRSYDPSAVKAAVVTTLTDTSAGPLAFSKTPIGAPLHVSSLSAACLRVPGVIAVRDLTLTIAGTSTPLGQTANYPGTGHYFSLEASAINAMPEAGNG